MHRVAESLAQCTVRIFIAPRSTDIYNAASSKVVLQRQCETLAAELEACKLDHRRTLDVVRADTEQLLRDNEILAAEASALKQGTAELVDERARSDSEKDAVVRELMELVQQQRVTLKQNKVRLTCTWSSMSALAYVCCVEAT